MTPSLDIVTNKVYFMIPVGKAGKIRLDWATLMIRRTTKIHLVIQKPTLRKLQKRFLSILKVKTFYFRDLLFETCKSWCKAQCLIVRNSHCENIFLGDKLFESNIFAQTRSSSLFLRVLKLMTFLKAQILGK